jgi:hypothetical protein
MASSFQSVRCLASAINVSSPLSRSYFAHRYSIVTGYFWELPRLHTKGKTRLDIHSIKTGILPEENVIVLNPVKIQVDVENIASFFHHVKLFFFCDKNIFNLSRNKH